MSDLDRVEETYKKTPAQTMMEMILAILNDPGKVDEFIQRCMDLFKRWGKGEPQ